MSGRQFFEELLLAVPPEHRRAVQAVLRRWHRERLYLPRVPDRSLDHTARSLVEARVATADAARALQARFQVARSTAYAALQRARAPVRD